MLIGLPLYLLWEPQNLFIAQKGLRKISTKFQYTVEPTYKGFMFTIRGCGGGSPNLMNGANQQ